MVEVRFAFIGQIEGVECTLDGETKYSDASGFCSFFDVTQGEHAYSVEKEGMYVLEGMDLFERPLGASGTTVIEWAPDPEFEWPEDQAWVMLFTLEVSEIPPEDLEGPSIMGKIGSIVSSIGFVGIFLNSARKR